MAEIRIIGTSHIAKESIKEIKRAFKEVSPDLVAVELDARRLYTLLNDGVRKLSLRDIRKVGIKGFLFAWIASFIQKRLGKYVGTPPGSDMLTAFKIARDNGAEVALIDRDITTTLRRFSKSLTWRERLRFIYDLTFGIFTRKRKLKRFGIKSMEDLRKVPSDKIVELMIDELRSRYPSIYKVLVEERNRYMARNIRKAIEHGAGKILVVVGAGHKPYLEKEFKDYLITS